MDELYWDDSAAPALYWPKEMLPFDTSDLLAIVEQTGADVLHGDAGDDLLEGGEGSDRLYGGEGNDTLLGGGNLTVEPLTLELNIEGYWNRLYLGNPEIPNNDYLDGGTGLDTMSGGTGDDTYIVDGVATEDSSGGVPALNLIDIARLEFEAVDHDTFRCLGLAYQALAAGGDAPTTLNAANEEAVTAFLAGRLPFLAIAEVIEQCLSALPARPADGLDALLDSDLTARRQAQRIIARLAGC